MTQTTSTAAPTYVTWDGIGPDKWASIWLIRRHLHPDARIIRAEQGSDTSTQGIPFDVPGAAYMRDSSVTTFEQLVRLHLPNDLTNNAQIDRISAIINEMEVNRWQIVDTSETGLVETGFRNLQFMFGREEVPFACYMAFFDAVEAMLARDGGVIDPQITDMGDKLCARSGENGETPRPLVQELAARDVLDQIGMGRKVVFVDTRERSEFDEFHIPGAVHMPLRNVSAEALKPLADADLVVPYCVKDFRGYEVARALSALGVHNVAILNPYGIRGWRGAGLPVTGSLALSQAEGDAALSNCGKDPASCLK